MSIVPGNTSFFRIALLAVLMLAPPAGTFAVTTVQYSFEELVEQSDSIMVGTASDVRSEWGTGAESGIIFTYVRFTDLEIVKGEATQKEYTLRIIGGTVGNQRQHYPGLPSFTQGKRYLVFVHDNYQAIFPVMGVTQGLYRVEWDPIKKRNIAIQSAHTNTVPIIPSRGITPPPQQDLETFLTDIRSRLGTKAAPQPSQMGHP